MTTETAPDSERVGRVRSDAVRPLPARPPRWALVVGWVAVVVPFVVEALTIVRANRAWLAVRLPDDAFYYLEIGRRVAEGDGLTFDGVNATNGVHPLWLAICALLASVIPGGDGLAKAALLVSLALVGAALLMVGLVVRRALGSGPALLGAALAASGYLLDRVVSGMEGALLVAALGLLVLLLARFEASPGIGRAAAVGLGCAVVVLSRLELVLALVPVVVAVVVLCRRSGIGLLRPLAAAAVAAGVVLVPFGVWHLSTSDGHLLTTSATVKATWMDDFVTEEHGGRLSASYAGYVAGKGRESAADLVATAEPRWARSPFGWLLVAGAVGGALVARAEQRAGRPVVRGPGGVALVAVASVVALKWILDLVLAAPWIDRWYPDPVRVALPLALGAGLWYLAAAALRASRPIGVAVAAALVLVVLPSDLGRASASASDTLEGHPWHQAIDEAAAWIEAEGPPGRYGAYDAGLLGYRFHGDRTVVNMDGLVNSYDYAALVEADASVPELVRAAEIDVLVNRLAADRLEQALSCGRMLWQADDPIAAPEGLAGVVRESPMVVIDVRGCR